MATPHIAFRIATALHEMLASGRRSNTIEIRGDRGTIDVYPVRYNDLPHEGYSEVWVEKVPIDANIRMLLAPSGFDRFLDLEVAGLPGTFTTIEEPDEDDEKL